MKYGILPDGTRQQKRTLQMLTNAFLLPSEIHREKWYWIYAETNKIDFSFFFPVKGGPAMKGLRTVDLKQHYAAMYYFLFFWATSFVGQFIFKFVVMVYCQKKDW